MSSAAIDFICLRQALCLSMRIPVRDAVTTVLLPALSTAWTTHNKGRIPNARARKPTKGNCTTSGVPVCRKKWRRGGQKRRSADARDRDCSRQRGGPALRNHDAHLPIRQVDVAVQPYRSSLGLGPSGVQF